MKRSFIFICLLTLSISTNAYAAWSLDSMVETARGVAGAAQGLWGRWRTAKTEKELKMIQWASTGTIEGLTGEEKKAHAETTDDEGKHVLIHAVEKGHLDVVKALLSYGVKPYEVPDAETANPVKIAYEHADSLGDRLMPIVNELLAVREEPEEQVMNGVIVYVASENLHSLSKILLKYDVNHVGKASGKGIMNRTHPIFVAIDKKYTAVLRMLLRYRVDPNFGEKTGDAEKIEEPKHKGLTPLYYAIDKASLSSVRALLEWGAHLDKALVNGLTPLEYATEKLMHLYADHERTDVRHPDENDMEVIVRELGGDLKLIKIRYKLHKLMGQAPESAEDTTVPVGVAGLKFKLQQVAKKLEKLKQQVNQLKIAITPDEHGFVNIPL